MLLTWVLTVFSESDELARDLLVRHPAADAARAPRARVASARSGGGSLAAAAAPRAAARRPPGRAAPRPSCAVRIARDELLRLRRPSAGSRPRRRARAGSSWSSSTKLVRTITRVAGPRSRSAADRLDAVEPGITRSISTTSGACRAGRGDRLLAVAASPTTSMSSCSVEERAQPLADDRVVVGDQHADRSASGTSSRTVVPAPGRRGDRRARRRARRARSSIEVSPSRRERSAGRVGVEADAVVGDRRARAARRAPSKPDGRRARAPAWRSAFWQRLLRDP